MCLALAKTRKAEISMLASIWTISIIFGIALFFLPTVIGIIRHKQNLVGILLVNLLAGWTFVGWVVALVWALSSTRRQTEADS